MIIKTSDLTMELYIKILIMISSYTSLIFIKDNFNSFLHNPYRINPTNNLLMY